MISNSIRHLKDRARQILHLNETPHELAKSFAAGVFVAFTPTIGLHTLTVLLIAWAFRLNKFVALTGTLVNNPWTMAFCYIAPTWLAVQVMEGIGIHIPPFNYGVLEAQFLQTMELYKIWQPVFWQTFLAEFKPYLHAFIIGTTLAGAVAAVVAYYLALNWIIYHRRRKELKKRGREHVGGNT